MLERAGQIALVIVSKPGHAPWFDLPGGAIDPGEDQIAGLVREFGEETGLKVAPGAFLGRADQVSSTPTARRSTTANAVRRRYWKATAPHLKIEEDHELVWAPPLEAAKELRHDSHAWAVIAWLRRRV